MEPKLAKSRMTLGDFRNATANFDDSTPLIVNAEDDPREGNPDGPGTSYGLALYPFEIEGNPAGPVIRVIAYYWNKPEPCYPIHLPPDDPRVPPDFS